MKYLFFLLTFVPLALGAESRVAFTLPDKEMFPEGITYASSTETFFVTSLHRKNITRVEIGPGGSAAITDFIAPGEYGFMSGVGMAVDETRGVLYALCGDTSGSGRAGLFQFALSGDLLHHTVVEDTTGSTLWNDIDVTQAGIAYFTDTLGSRILTFDPDTKTVTPLVEGPEFPNGLAVSADEAFLYVATYRQGIQRLNLVTLEWASAHADTNTGISNGIDGLSLYRDPESGASSLIGIVNAYRDRSKHAVIRYHLNNHGLISRHEILDRNHPRFNVPTTGVVVGDAYYCIANGQFDYLNMETMAVTHPDSLEAITILGYSLR